MKLTYKTFAEVLQSIYTEFDASFLSQNESLINDLMYDEDIELAFLIAATVHENDKYGDKHYLYHLVEVYNGVHSKAAKILAFLHDTLEDYPDLINLDFIEDTFGKEIRDALYAITHQEDEFNVDYWLRCKKDLIALEAKISDVGTNLYHSIREGVLHRIQKYALAMSRLTDFTLEPDARKALTKQLKKA